MKDRPLPPRILCVEDNPTLCESLQNLLKRLPARVDRALDGDSALDMLIDANQHSDPFELVILDMWVPKEEGAEVDRELGLKLVIKLLAQQKSLQLLPLNGNVIVFTAHPDWKHCVECMRHGAADYILKGDASDIDADKLKTLFDRCKELLYPEESDELGAWFLQNKSDLLEGFAAKVVAVFDKDAATTGLCQQVGDRFVIAGESYEEVRDKMLADKVLRWEPPQVLTIPAEAKHALC